MFKLIKRLSAREWGMVGLTVAFIFLAVYLDLEVPSYMKEVATLLQTPGVGLDQLMGPGALMLGLSLASFASLVMVGFLAARLAASYTTRLRSDIYSQVLSYSDADYHGPPGHRSRSHYGYLGHDQDCGQVRGLALGSGGSGLNHHFNDCSPHDLGLS